MNVYTTPRTRLVALEGGPQHHQWFFYADWLALRLASRRGRYPLAHPCGSERCYLPTERFTENADPHVTRRHGQARVWVFVAPEQWARWGREYFTPEEISEHQSERNAA